MERQKQASISNGLAKMIKTDIFSVLIFIELAWEKRKLNKLQSTTPKEHYF
jgi:hypothetical protein